MTNESINEIISQLNGEQLAFPYVICKYQISKTVEYAKVWDNKAFDVKTGTIFYFIKGKDKYVGAVNVLANDLHWFVLEEVRNQGLLTNALKTAIIPHFFETSEKDYIKITINENSEETNNHLASKKVADKLGFRKIGEDKYVLDKDLFEFSSACISIKHPGIEDNDYEALVTEIKNISTRLHQIHAFFEFSSGLKMEKYQTPTISQLAETLNTRRWSLEDMYHDQLMANDNQ